MLSEIAIRFIESNIVITDGPNYGQPLILAPYQKDFIRAVLDPTNNRNKRIVRTGVLSIAKKKWEVVFGGDLRHSVSASPLIRHP